LPSSPIKLKIEEKNKEKIPENFIKRKNIIKDNLND